MINLKSIPNKNSLINLKLRFELCLAIILFDGE